MQVANYKSLGDPFVFHDVISKKNRILSIGDNDVLYVWNWASGCWVPYMSWEKAKDLGLADPSVADVREFD